MTNFLHRFLPDNKTELQENERVIALLRRNLTTALAEVELFKDKLTALQNAATKEGITEYIKMPDRPPADVLSSIIALANWSVATKKPLDAVVVYESIYNIIKEMKKS